MTEHTMPMGSRPASIESHGSALAAAVASIVDELCASAVWDSGGTRCNWVGRRDVIDAAPGTAAAAGAVGPDLYAGSTGIALFLAEAARSGFGSDAAAVAAGALRRSTSFYKSERIKAVISPLSFFAGHLGAAYVAARLRRVAPEIDLDEDLSWLMEQVRAARPLAAPSDLVSGCAGAIPALLLLAREPGLGFCEELAFRCGEQICATATWDGEDCAWSPADQVLATAPLTGMSHGAAGAARALLELYARTGHAPFLRTARGAFAFEDSHFSVAAGNWIDTRSPYLGERGNRTGRCITTWCHGAPGIALARARATVLDPDRGELHAEAVRVGASATLAELGARSQTAVTDATLCHGIAGLSEILISLGEMMHDNTWTQRGLDAAHELAASHDPADYWPSGVNAGGPNPTLMIGSAGVGHHLLRAADGGETPSVLLVPCRSDS
jgi:lantibiotic modifying enzyme